MLLRGEESRMPGEGGGGSGKNIEEDEMTQEQGQWREIKKNQEKRGGESQRRAEKKN